MRWSFKQRNYAGLPIGLALALMFPITHDAAQGREIDEYQSKAVCLYNFAKFVEWPRDTFKGPADPIVVCILGESPLGSALQPAVKGKPIGTQSLIIRQVSSIRQTSGCQILFVSSSEAKRARKTLCESPSEGILTIGETDDFASEGGVVNFKLEGQKVRIQINVEAAQRAKLRISSQLLSLAQIVKQATK